MRWADRTPGTYLAAVAHEASAPFRYRDGVTRLLGLLGGAPESWRPPAAVFPVFRPSAGARRGGAAVAEPGGATPSSPVSAAEGFERMAPFDSGVPRMPSRQSAARRPAVGPEAVGPEAVGPEAVGPEAVGPEAVGPEAVRPKAVRPKAVRPAEAPVAAAAIMNTASPTSTPADLGEFAQRAAPTLLDLSRPFPDLGEFARRPAPSFPAPPRPLADVDELARQPVHQPAPSFPAPCRPLADLEEFARPAAPPRMTPSPTAQRLREAPLAGSRSPRPPADPSPTSTPDAPADSPPRTTAPDVPQASRAPRAVPAGVGPGFDTLLLRLNAARTGRRGVR